jgi:hypothetical protein
VKSGSTTTEFTYDNYDDWNNPLNKVQAFYAGKMVEKRNGTVVRDLTTTETETGSVYVVMPVPASVKAAIKNPGPSPAIAIVSRGDEPPPSKEPTPRLANGKPDMTGALGFGGPNWRYGFRRCAPNQGADCTNIWNQTIDFEFEAPPRYGPNRPIYKPELWDKIQELDQWTNKKDPVMTCLPLGLPRQGPPARIYQTDHDITFLYRAGVDGGGGYTAFRVIPTDGRKHDPQQAELTRFYGYTVGRWEGDTLVLDSISFDDRTWLSRGGFFHSDQMHVVEKFTRKGNDIRYEVTIEDPEVLAEPWVMTPQTLRLAANDEAGLLGESSAAHELRAIRSHELREENTRHTGSLRIAGYLHVLAGLDRRLGPAEIREVQPPVELHGPFLHGALVVGDVDLRERMRIHEPKLLDGTVERDRVAAVELRRERVMSERGRQRSDADGRRDQPESTWLHGVFPSAPLGAAGSQS